jgi:uncharacterized protein (DUF2141 family)
MTSRNKQLICAFILAISGLTLVSAQKPAKCTLTVKVTGIHDSDGDVKMALRSGLDTIVQSRALEIDPKTMTATAVFDSLEPGTYGVATFHDENKNGKIDFDDVGMPVEGYGHSNNPAKRMGPPNFDETKFAVSAPTTSIEIELVYWP